MRNKGNKGITLIALVITIIVLLILAGISIAMLTGKNGILNQAQTAKEETELAEEEELLRLAYNEYKIKENVGANNIDPSVTGAVVETVTDGWKVTFDKSGNIYKLGKDGSVTRMLGDSIQYDTVPEDFWVVTSGSLTINSEYLTTATYSGAYGNKANSTGNFTCEYTKLEIPSEVNGIAITKLDNKMPNMLNITHVKVDEGIAEIGDQSLVRWVALTNIELPTTLTKIGNGAFAGCSSLQSIDIPSNVTSIGGSAFESCTALKNVTIPDSVTSIGNESAGYHLGNGWYLQSGNTFKNCTSLKNIYIPSSVSGMGAKNFDYVGYSLFYGCSSDLRIYCGAGAAQSGWAMNTFNNGTTVLTVNYSYTRADYESAIAK